MSALGALPYRCDEHVSVWHGSCLEVLRAMPDASVDAIVTDPPYGLSDIAPRRVVDAIAAWASGDRERVPDGRGFMGSRWDSFVPPPAVWDECLRVLRPGGHLLAFAGARTYDLMGLSIRLSGAEIRDGLATLYSQGFPKSLNVARAIDRATGVTMKGWVGPVSDSAKEWDGFGTALKPAFEPVVMARRPLTHRGVAGSVLEHGTGALNVDASRIGAGGGRRWPANVVLVHAEGCRLVGTQQVRTSRHDPKARGRGGLSTSGMRGQDGLVERKAGLEVVESWECVPGCPAAEMDSQSGVLTSGAGNVRGRSGADRDGNTSAAFGKESRPAGSAMISYGDTGGASRFFAQFGAEDLAAFRYQAKAPGRVRPSYVAGDGTVVAHPTVKSLALMRWLVRLVCPPGGTVLDPFAGSGTTGEAALIEGFDVVLVEREAQYLPLIDQRLDRAPSTAQRGAA